MTQAHAERMGLVTRFRRPWTTSWAPHRQEHRRGLASIGRASVSGADRCGARCLCIYILYIHVVLLCRNISFPSIQSPLNCISCLCALRYSWIWLAASAFFVAASRVGVPRGSGKYVADVDHAVRFRRTRCEPRRRMIRCRPSQVLAARTHTTNQTSQKQHTKANTSAQLAEHPAFTTVPPRPCQVVPIPLPYQRPPTLFCPPALVCSSHFGLLQRLSLFWTKIMPKKPKQFPFFLRIEREAKSTRGRLEREYMGPAFLVRTRGQSSSFFLPSFPNKGIVFDSQPVQSWSQGQGTDWLGKRV